MSDHNLAPCLATLSANGRACPGGSRRRRVSFLVHRPLAHMLRKVGDSGNKHKPPDLGLHLLRPPQLETPLMWNSQAPLLLPSLRVNFEKDLLPASAADTHYSRWLRVLYILLQVCKRGSPLPPWRLLTGNAARWVLFPPRSKHKVFSGILLSGPQFWWIYNVDSLWRVTQKKVGFPIKNWHINWFCLWESLQLNFLNC